MSGAAQPAAGRRFEYKVRDDLRDNGYFVMRSPASKSAVDMIAVKQGQVLAVQCKLTWRLDPAEWNALYDHRIYGMIPLAASRPARGQILYRRLMGYKTAEHRSGADLWEAFILDEVEAGR